MKTEAYINKIVEDTGLTKKEIQDLVGEKKQELKGLISDEGALFIIAKELGVDVKNENKALLNDIELNISDITANMKNISIVGRIKDIYSVNSFTKKDGEPGYVGSFVLHDNTGDIRVVLWDEHVNIFKDENFGQNELVKVLNGYAKEGRYGGIEIHLSRLGKVNLSPEDVDYNKYPKIESEFTQIKDIRLSSSLISLEGKIIQKYPVKEFVRKNGDSGKLASTIIMDSTGSLRITFWNEDTDILNSIETGDFVSITNLSPRENKFDPKTIDLHATKNTVITKKEKKVKIEADLVSNIKLLQDQEHMASFQGVISSIDDLRSVTLKSGEEVSLLGFIVSDDTDGIRVTLWRDQAEEFSKVLANGTGVSLKNVMLKYSTFSGRKEVSLISESEIKMVDLEFSNLKKMESITRGKFGDFSRKFIKINSIDSAGIVEVKGFVAKEINKITIYEACSNCRKKIENCSCDDKGESKQNMIINLTIDDESGTIRTAFIGEIAERMIGESPEVILKIMDTPDYEKFLEKVSADLIGKDIIIKARAKFSDFSNSYELVASNFQYIDISKELELEVKEIGL